MMGKADMYTFVLLESNTLFLHRLRVEEISIRVSAGSIQLYPAIMQHVRSDVADVYLVRVCGLKALH